MMERLAFAMSVQFSRDGAGGWLYRKDQTGPALPATEAERGRYVRWYGWIVVTSLILLFELVVAYALVVDRLLPSPTNGQSLLVTCIAVPAVLAATYAYLRYFSHAPARDFAGRRPVAPPRRLRDVHGGAVRTLSNAQLLRRCGMMVGLFAVAALVRPGMTASDRLAFFALGIGLLTVVGIGLWLWRRRIENG